MATRSVPEPTRREPSWPKVIATTLRLWLRRRGRRMRIALAAVCLVVAVGAAVAVSIVLAAGAPVRADLVQRGADRSLRAVNNSTVAAASLGRSFEAAMAADLQVRIAAGQQLLHDKNVHAGSAARAALTEGSVDARLLVVLAKLAGQRRISVVIVGLREARVAAATTGQLRSMLSFLRGQQAPYLPAQATLVRVARGKYVLDIQYDAPSPIGLLG
ncbi:MAG TPA: hypothetical protein VF070_17295 [Streptosporangiaceae bacterium]